MFSEVLIASGSYVGNGGDTIYCRPSTENSFNGRYTLDFLIEYKTIQQPLRPFIDISTTQLELADFFKRELPELYLSYQQYTLSLFKEYSELNRSWKVSNNGLLNIQDENIQKLIPTNCLKSQGETKSLELHQTVIRDSISSNLIYYFDPILIDLQNINPQQFSFFILHEWLWDFTRNTQLLRKINWLLHSKELLNLSRQKILTIFDQYDFFLTPLEGCEKSFPFKDFLSRELGNDCSTWSLLKLAQFKEVAFSTYSTSNSAMFFRPGDFYGFGRVEYVNMSKLNLMSHQIHPRFFSALYKLKNLDLSSNKIGTLSELVLNDLQKIETLNISFNPIKIHVIDFRFFKKLRKLSLTASQLSEVKEIKFPQTLKEIDVFLDDLSQKSVLEKFKNNFSSIQFNIIE